MKALLVVLALSLPLQAQEFGNRALRGPSVWVLDSVGNLRAANLDPATLVLDPPGTAGAPPTLRAIIPPAVQSTLRMRIFSFAASKIAPILLPETPAVNTTVLLFWGPLLQPPEEYSVVGNALTLKGPGWSGGERMIAVYFW